MVTVALLAAGEGLARLVVGPAPARPAAVQAAHGDDYVATTLTGLDIAPELNPSPLIEDPYVLWRNKPLARKTQPVNPAVFGRSDTWTIENDSAGYRGPERPPAGDEDAVYRILCVGDSVTFGFNVDQPDPYPRRLEARLRERHPGRRIEVVNAGVPGWTWVQGLRFLEAYGLRLRPDLVIAAHGTNDQFWRAVITDRERLPGGGVPAPEMRPATALERTSLYRLLAGVGRRWRAAEPPLSPVCRATQAGGETCRRVPLADITRTVGEMHDRLRSAGAELIVANMDFMETKAVEGVRRAAAERQLPYLDLVAHFHALDEAEDAARAAELGLRPAGAGAPAAPRRVLFRVLVPASASEPVSVRGGGYLRDDVRFELPLRDDGAGGDERAGDRIFSGVLEVGADVGALEYVFWLGDTAEFTPLPPLRSTSGTRLVRLGSGETVAPVVVFAERRRMAERTHPNAAGQAEIAERFAEVVEAQPSFRAWLDRL